MWFHVVLLFVSLFVVLAADPIVSPSDSLFAAALTLI